jgi:hypothetical protein
VTVHDRRTMSTRDLPCGPHAGRNRERCRNVRGRAHADVGAHGLCVAEDVQRRHGGVPEEMKMDAAFARVPCNERMPWGDDVNGMPARGNRFRNRVHERADAVSGKPGVRRRYHHDDVALVGVCHRCFMTPESVAPSKHEPPGDDQRLEENAGGNLRISLLAFDEDDRDLADAASTASRFEEHLDEEGIAVGDHAIEGELA